MRRRVGISVALLALALLGTALARGEVRRVDGLQLNFNGGITPRALPRERPAPITVSVEGRISMADGSHPPPLRSLEIKLSNAGRLSTVGLPTCPSAAIQSSATKLAVARCPGAVVGHGRFAADLQGNDTPIPAFGRIVAFNSVHKGRPALLLHLYGTTPIQASLVLPLQLRRPGSKSGTVLAAEIPRFAGGVGSITEIELELGRRYSYKGERRSFISASCAAPAGFSGGPFTLARGVFRFANGTNIATTLTRTCRVRD